MISCAARQRALNLVAQGLEQGAVLELDGRGVQVDGYPNGNFFGPTILSGSSRAWVWY